MLKQEIDKDLVGAMKESDEKKVTVLRMLKSAIKNKEIETKKDLEDADIISVIQNQIKQRKDALKMYTEAGRKELADKEQAEIDVLQPYLPEQMSENDIKAIVEKVISDTGASSMQDMGKVMGAVMPQTKGKADPSKVSQIVKDTLSK